MVMYAKIRRMYFREKQSVSAIARKTSLSRNTIKKWLREPSGSETKYRGNQTEKVVTAFEPWLLQALKIDAHRPKRDRRTARMLFQTIRTQGFSGSYCRVTEWVSAWRALGDTRFWQVRLRAAQIQAGRSVPVRLERGIVGDWRHLAQGHRVAHQVVFQPRLLHLRVSRAKSRDVVRRP